MAGLDERSTREAMRFQTEAPLWLRRLFTPLLARTIARQMMRQHPDATPVELAERVRADRGLARDAASGELVDRIEHTLRGAARAAPDAASDSRLPSAIALVLANLVPVYGVLFLDWPVFPLIVLFWMENVIVGAMNVLRMASVDPRDPALWIGKLVLIPFFCVHYGLFTLGHGAFVFGMFGEGVIDAGLFPVDDWTAAIDHLGLWLPASALLASHLFSFAWNHLWRGEYRIASLPELMTQPYRRVVVLHVTIIFGGMAAMMFGSPVWALLLMMGLKIGVDLRAHLAEHRTRTSAPRARVAARAAATP